MIRLDKYCCDLSQGTRNEVKKLIRSGAVSVNGETVRDPDRKIDEETAQVICAGKELRHRKNTYLMLYKPQGVVSATEDGRETTVVDLCRDFGVKGLFPVGRLDKDTEGLLLMTDDGALSHRLLSPKKHVTKIYEVTIDHPLTAEQIHVLEEGVDIGDETKTMPARVQVIEERLLHLAIMEGRFHQVKRMLEAVGNEVTHLKRLQMGGLYLDPSLEPGQYRELTVEEVLSLNEKTPKLDGIQAIIFDVDGSLVDSMGMWEAIDIEYLARFGLPMPDHFQSELDGMSFYQTAAYFKKRFQIPDTLEQMMDDWNRMAWDKYLHEIELKPGALQFLQYCRQRGIRMGIATSNSRELMTNLEQAHGLTQYISCIVTGSEVPNGKPAPDIYLEAAAQLQVDPADCLVFEDIVAGILAGKAAGMQVCAVRDTYSRSQDRQKHELADYYIEDYYQILDRTGI